jgi:hypothetical protein
MRKYIIRYTTKNGEKVERHETNENYIANLVNSIQGVKDITIEIKEL